MSDLFGNHIVGFPTRRLISTWSGLLCQPENTGSLQPKAIQGVFMPHLGDKCAQMFSFRDIYIFGYRKNNDIWIFTLFNYRDRFRYTHQADLT